MDKKNKFYDVILTTCSVDTRQAGHPTLLHPPQDLRVGDPQEEGRVCRTGNVTCVSPPQSYYHIKRAQFDIISPNRLISPLFQVIEGLKVENKKYDIKNRALDFEVRSVLSNRVGSDPTVIGRVLQG